MPDHEKPNTRRKKDLILDYRATHRLERAGPAEIRAIEADLRRRLGPQPKTSASYIASVLRAAGTRLEFPRGFDARYADQDLGEPYAGHLDGALRFRDLESAEAAIRKLDGFYHEYRSASDRLGTQIVRGLGIKGKRRAESLARNPRVSLEKRREKLEIANWFRVWLEVPDLFFDWLELRKQSDEFRRAFGEDTVTHPSAPAPLPEEGEKRE